MVPFTLRQLEYFVATAQHGSMAAAASVLHVSTTALAQALTELERIMDAQLLVRRRAKGVELTSTGVSFLADCRPVVTMAQAIAHRVVERKQGVAGPLALGCYASLVPFWAPVITAEFIRPNDRLDLTIVEGDAVDLQRQMSEGRLDAVLLHRRNVLPGVEAHLVQSARPYALLAADHPLARRASLRLADLAPLDFVQLDLPSVRRTQVENLRDSGLEPRVRWRSANFEAVRAMVGRGLGYTVLVQRPASRVTYDGYAVTALEIEDDIGHSDVCIATTSDQRPSLRLRALIEFCQRAAAQQQPPTVRSPAG